LSASTAGLARRTRNIAVVYTYGFTTPPAAITGIVEDLVAGALTHAARNRATKGASSMSMDGYSCRILGTLAADGARTGADADARPISTDRGRVNGGDED
jgi:hypothetical protein